MYEQFEAFKERFKAEVCQFHLTGWYGPIFVCFVSVTMGRTGMANFVSGSSAKS
jgi:hypothetical protein